MIQLVLSTASASIRFEDTELPERITVGGEQLIAVHQLIGGARILDALGPSDRALDWSGVFQGASAIDRARFVDTLRRDGQEITLSWGPFRYVGLVSQFEADYTRAGLYVPYRITIQVASDRTAAVRQAPPLSPVQAIQMDRKRADTLAACVNDSTLSGLHTAVQSAVDAVGAAVRPMARGLQSAVAAASGTVGCAVAQINAGIQSAQAAIVPIAAAQAQAQKLITDAEQTIMNVASAGGFLPGNPVAKNVGAILDQANAATRLPPLYEYVNILARTQSNLQVLQANGPTRKTVTVGGGTLMQVASQQYGDATLWPLIAQANGLTDPHLTGIHTLIIPPKP